MVKLKSKNKKGLTLLELVIALGLMSIITMLVFSFTNTTQRKSKELEIRQKLQHEGTMITESLMKNVLHADGIMKMELSSAGSTNISSIEFLLAEDVVGDKNQAVRYRKDGKDLKLSEIIRENVSTATATEVETQKGIVTSYVKNIEVLNSEIKNYVISKPADTKIAIDELKKMKSINLKITLEHEYYNKAIEYEHIIELNLRNAK